jgi:hypothetical protein
VIVYFAPAAKRQLFSDLVKTGLKGSGDYGVFAIGAFNGQTANKPELNKNKHIVARISYPMAIGNQIIEPGIQAYTGIFMLTNDKISDSVNLPTDHSFIDQRMAMSFILYPKPFGIMAEYNFGKGPEYNPTIDSITVQALHGFYTTFSYMARINRFLFTPYARLQYYNGGKKAELDSRSYEVKELEFGTEWLPFPQFELTLAYIISSRWTADHSNKNNLQKGSLLRVQGQVNF